MKLCKCGCNIYLKETSTAEYIRGHSNIIRIGKTIEQIYGIDKANQIKDKVRFKLKKPRQLSKQQYLKEKLSREKNKERNYLYQHNWRIQNKEHNKKYKKFIKDINPNMHIIECLRARIGRALKQQQANKSYNTISITGCTIGELKKHLKKQFKPGMTWQNHGQMGWHIDHIIPCKNFDLTKPEEQKKCFHYTNLQPLWWYENLSKNKVSILNKQKNQEVSFS